MKDENVVMEVDLFGRYCSMRRYGRSAFFVNGALPILVERFSLRERGKKAGAHAAGGSGPARNVPR